MHGMRSHICFSATFALDKTRARLHAHAIGLKLREEHRRVLLPLLIILAIAITLVVLLFAHRDTGNLETQSAASFKDYDRTEHSP